MELDRTRVEVKQAMTANKASEEEDDRETLGKDIWRGKCGQRASGSAGERWKRKQMAELGVEWSVCRSEKA